jgi:excisionase family DNA binding protein
MTTGEVATACNVGTTTVHQWIASGRLKSFRLPGSNHRRIHRSDLDTFRLAHGMIAASDHTALLIGVSEADTATIAGQVDGSYLATAGSLWEAGRAFHATRPDTVVVDPSVGHDAANAIRAEIESRPSLGTVRLIWLDRDIAPPPGYEMVAAEDAAAAVNATKGGRR